MGLVGAETTATPVGGRYERKGTRTRVKNSKTKQILNNEVKAKTDLLRA